MMSVQRSPATGGTDSASAKGKRLSASSPGRTVPPLGVTLHAAIPAGLVMIAPAVAAVVLGFRARRHGAAPGNIPAVIGIVVVVYGIAANLLQRLLSM